MISYKYYLFLFLLFFVACQEHSNSIGLQQVELKHEKAVRLHQYLKDEVALLTNDKSHNVKTIQVGRLSYFNKEALLKKDDLQFKDFQKLIQKQSVVLENQKIYLEKYKVEQLTIQEQETLQNKIKTELKIITTEVQQACSEINKLARTLRQAKKESTIQLANI